MLERREPAPGVLELRLDRPPANALTGPLLEAIAHGVSTASETGARAVVLSGRPGMFSAGLDVPFLLGLGREEMRHFWHTFFGALGTIARSPVPVGVAITGHCPAGGTVIALFADYRVAAAGEFKLGLNEVEVGLPMPAIVFHAFRRLLGTRVAEQLAVAGTLLSPADALAAGLVDAVVAPEAVIDAAVERARALTVLPQGALAATRRLARADLAALFDDLDHSDYEAMNEVWFGPETQATMRALVERLAQRSARRDHRDLPRQD